MYRSVERIDVADAIINIVGIIAGTEAGVFIGAMLIVNEFSESRHVIRLRIFRVVPWQRNAHLCPIRSSG